VVYFSVADIEAALAKVAASGGKTLVPRTDIGEFGAFAHFADSEGNRVGLHTM
jgi:predicted enzyme related to lactoylglutathione lyase